MMLYRTIVADPPWPYGKEPLAFKWRRGRPSGDGKCFLSYPTMPLDAICKLPVASCAEADAHLYLWTTQRFLQDAYSVAKAWGFHPIKALVWCKAPTGFALGGSFGSALEFIIFARRGTLPTLRKVSRDWFQWPRRRHSEKPEAFQDMVEQVSPGPYLELFARRKRLGWDVWGNEVESSISLEVPAC